MKYTFLILILQVSFSVFSQNQRDENGKKNGEWITKYSNGVEIYENFDGGVRTGHYEKFELLSDSLILTEQGNYLNDKKHGLWIKKSNYRCKNDELSVDSTFFSNGLKQNKSIFRYCNGRTSQINHYENDTLHGKSHKYYQNVDKGISHQPWIIGEYKKGKKTGVWITYEWGSDRLTKKENYDKGEFYKYKYFYYPTGELKMVNSFLNSKEHGEWISYHKSGQQKYIGYYENGKVVKEESWGSLDSTGLQKKTKNELNTSYKKLYSNIYIASNEILDTTNYKYRSVISKSNTPSPKYKNGIQGLIGDLHKNLINSYKLGRISREELGSYKFTIYIDETGAITKLMIWDKTNPLLPDKELVNALKVLGPIIPANDGENNIRSTVSLIVP